MMPAKLATGLSVTGFPQHVEIACYYCGLAAREYSSVHWVAGHPSAQCTELLRVHVECLVRHVRDGSHDGHEGGRS
jgi:hypothetical protein